MFNFLSLVWINTEDSVMNNPGSENSSWDQRYLIVVAYLAIN